MTGVVCVAACRPRGDRFIEAGRKSWVFCHEHAVRRRSGDTNRFSRQRVGDLVESVFRYFVR